MQPEAEAANQPDQNVPSRPTGPLLVGRVTPDLLAHFGMRALPELPDGSVARLARIAAEVEIDLATVNGHYAITAPQTDHDAVAEALAYTPIQLRRRGSEPLIHWLIEQAAPGVPIGLCPDGLTLHQMQALRFHLWDAGFGIQCLPAPPAQEGHAPELAAPLIPDPATLTLLNADLLLTSGHWAGAVTGLRARRGGAPEAWLHLRNGQPPVVLTRMLLPTRIISALRARGVEHALQLRMAAGRRLLTDHRRAPARIACLLPELPTHAPEPTFVAQLSLPDIDLDAEASALNIAFDCAMIETLAELDSGHHLSERELGVKLSRRLQRCVGYKGLSFPIFVSAGARSARPHPVPSTSDAPLHGPVLIDAGLHGATLTTDATRTLLPAAATPLQRQIYTTVLRSLVRASLSPEARPHRIDAILTAALNDGPGHVMHGWGHAVMPGLDVHGQHSLLDGPEILRDGTYFTLEPAKYSTGRVGVRLENLYQVRKGRPRCITCIPLDLRHMTPGDFSLSERQWLESYNAGCLVNRIAVLSPHAANWCRAVSAWGTRR